ncbi:hypothetical protein MAKP2_03980 [Klebsiella pneumoniae subsp. pneumoniae]|nr:hypothetical protein MAKP1_11660 [Klebsiella pneumoniae subsp. pneumoniae]GHM02787.1 hypothetical protein KPZU40_27620 [Klebsiella pneumoniae]GFM44095.1 hypothetical protein MAKP2_03980 [Klebsiella pneumoniae subsp. pneumoniae]GKL96751.1 hypothetical protein NUBL13936_48360 [Klebsiella pneumoniae]GKN40909.1 hypothetical protein MS5451_47270 [Klebsiella pneumoniae]
MSVEKNKKNRVKTSANVILITNTAPKRLLAETLSLSTNARYLGINPPEIISDENKLIGDNKTV